MKKLAVILSAAVMALAFGTASNAATTELSMQSNFGPGHVLYREVQAPWAASFKDKSNGSLIINIFAMGSILEDKEVYTGLKSGMIDIAPFNAYLLPKEFPLSTLATLPMLYNTSTEGTKVFWKWYDELPGYKEAITDPGPIIAMWAGAPCGFLSVNTPVRTPADIAGKRVLCSEASYGDLVKKLGGIPVFVSMGDIYVGLQRGMGEMIYTALPFASSMKLQEVVKYVTPVAIRSSLLQLNFSQTICDMIPPEASKMILDNSGRELSLKHAAVLDRNVSEVTEQFKASGVEFITLTEEEKKAFQEISQDLISEITIPTLKAGGVKEPEKTIELARKLAEEITNAQ